MLPRVSPEWSISVDSGVRQSERGGTVEGNTEPGNEPYVGDVLLYALRANAEESQRLTSVSGAGDLALRHAEAAKVLAEAMTMLGIKPK